MEEDGFCFANRSEMEQRDHVLYLTEKLWYLLNRALHSVRRIIINKIYC